MHRTIEAMDDLSHEEVLQMFKTLSSSLSFARQQHLVKLLEGMDASKYAAEVLICVPSEDLGPEIQERLVGIIERTRSIGDSQRVLFLAGRKYDTRIRYRLRKVRNIRGRLLKH